MMLTDFMQDPNVDTAVLILRVHVGRTYLKPRFSYRYEFPFYDLHTTSGLRI